MKYLGKIQDNKDLVTKEYVDNKTPPDASTSQKGIVQLNDATNSTSTTQAATANAVKKAYDHYPSAASTSTAGIVQLSSSTSGTSTTKAATESAVKAAYDHGGVTSVNGSTGAVTISSGTSIVVQSNQPSSQAVGDFWYQVIS